MKEKLQVIALLVLLSLAANENTVFARSWESGVAEGDFFTFEMYGIYTSNHSNTTIAIPPFERNNTDWARINITAVLGSMVYQVYTLHFRNGSETSFNFKTELNPENESFLKFSEKGIPICAANLNSGDRIPTAELILNDTEIRVHLGVSKETNHASWNVSDDWGSIYFDKETGMLIELFRIHQFDNNVTGEIVEKADVIKLIDTNRWETKTGEPSMSLSFVLSISGLAFFVLITVVYQLVTRKTRINLIAKGL